MTVTRLAYAHAGASRRLTAEALIKGDIQPSPEAEKLVANLESQLGWEELKDSISATNHFFQSIKTPKADLRYEPSRSQGNLSKTAAFQKELCLPTGGAAKGKSRVPAGISFATTIKSSRYRSWGWSPCRDQRSRKKFPPFNSIQSGAITE